MSGDSSGASMDLGPVGVWSIDLRFHPDHGLVAEAAAELEELGYGALWIPGGIGGDVLADIGRLLEATDHVPAATGILNIWMHEPADVARDFAALDEAHPGRFLLGIGRSHSALINSDDDPERYRRPMAATAAFLDGLDEAGTVPRERIALASLGPKSLKMAGERTAGTHPYFVPVEHTRFAREILGPGPLVAPEQAVVLDASADSARATARAHMAIYLTLPNYTDNLIRLGFTEQDLADGGSDRLVDALVAWGDEEAIAARVREHHVAGADHVTLQVLGAPEGELPLDAWRRIAPAVVG